MAVTVTTLVDDGKPEHLGLVHEHGLSFHIKTPHCEFLFDTGGSGASIRNAATLNISLANLDFVACSHAHYDHTNGLRVLAGRFTVPVLLTGPGFFRPKYEVSGIRHAYIGPDFGPEFLESAGIAHEAVEQIRQVDERCWLLGDFSGPDGDEVISRELAILDDGVFRPDRFEEEICLAIRFEDGLAVLLGCSHPGVITMLQTVHRRLGLPIRGVWGGTHLHKASAERVARTVAALKRMGVRHVGLSHCSGDALLERIEADPDIRGCRLRTGDGVFL